LVAQRLPERVAPSAAFRTRLQLRREFGAEPGNRFVGRIGLDAELADDDPLRGTVTLSFD